MNVGHFSFQGKLNDCRLTNTNLIVEVPSTIVSKNLFTIQSRLPLKSNIQFSSAQV